MDIKQSILAKLERVTGPDSQGNYKALCPFHNDREHPNLSVNFQKGGYHCFACGSKGDIRRLAQRLGIAIANHKPPAEAKTIIANYNYTDEAGTLLYQTVRYDPKDFTQRRPGVNGDWVRNLKDTRLVLYYLPEVLKAKREERTVFKTAGEKDADNLRAIGVTATTNPLGEGKGKWKAEYTETLKGAHVVLIEDKDTTGRRHGLEVAHSLYGTVASLKVLELPDRDGRQVKDASDWLAAGGTRQELEKLVNETPEWQPPQDKESITHIVDARLTDTGNAELLASLFSDRIRYDHRRRRWLLWKDHRWQPDRDGHISRLAVEATRNRYTQAEIIKDLKERQRVATWAISSESRMRIEACISLARNIAPIADSGEHWDYDPWLLGVNNGVVDLKTGMLRSGQPGDRITMTTGVDFDPQAKCPQWHQFLATTFDDKDLIDWLQRALGYSITGDTTEQCVFIGYGTGANGKSVFRGAFNSALGDYAYSSPFSTFELYQRASIPNDLAALEFKRFVSSSETNDNTRLNEARIKAISGCDPITARYLHQEYFTFWPHLKLWLFVNHRPKVTDDSFGFWRRVRLIPFTHQFIGEADDQRLSEKLKAEAEGILAWLIHGCLEWQERGLEPIPECVKVATQEYRQESDVLAGFISDRCIEHPQATSKASGLYATYKEWAESEGMRDREVLTSTAFGRRMRDRYKKDRKGGTVHYFGIGLAGQLQDSFKANDTENNVFPIYNNSRVETKKTILNYPAEAKTDENYPAPEGNPPKTLPPCINQEGASCSYAIDHQFKHCSFEPWECPFLKEQRPNNASSDSGANKITSESSGLVVL